MSPRLGPVLVLALALLAPSGCSINPVTGRPQITILSKGAERTISEREADEVARTLGVVSSAPLAPYVEAVGARLAALSPRQDVTYTFQVLDRPEPNAFSLPAGPIFVTRGLLALLNDEDELAGVLGHEIGHVAARHAARRATVQAPFALVFGLPAAIAGAVNGALGRLVSVPGKVADALVVAPFSRAQEQQADDVGMEIAARAGYDPAALALALSNLEREQAALTGNGERPARFLDSHPTTRARVDRILRHEAELPRAEDAPVAPDRAAFLGKLEGLLLGTDPDEGVFDGSLFLHPTLDFRMPFPEGWRTSNQERAVFAVERREQRPAFVVLQLTTRSNDPLDGPRADRVPRRVIEESEALVVNGLPALRARVTRGGDAYDVVWVAHAGNVFRVASVCGEERSVELAGVFEAVATGFAPLRDADRARIRVERLRLESPRPGEALDQLLRRSESAWDAERAAIMNGLETPSSPLPPGVPVKLGVVEPWSG